MMRYRITLLILSCIFFLHSFAAIAQSSFSWSFSSEIVDQDAVPVTAILPLKFKIYRAGSKVVWSEIKFVSVVDGKYTVYIGNDDVASLDPSSLTVGVELNGREILRTKLLNDKNKRIRIRPPETGQIKTGSYKNAEGSFRCETGYVMIGMDFEKDGDGNLRARAVCALLQ